MDEGEDEPVPLPNVNAAILKKVIQWCTYHKDDPQPAEDDENKEKRTDDICTWDVEFLKVDQGTLFELILVSIFKSVVVWVTGSPSDCRKSRSNNFQKLTLGTKPEVAVENFAG